jgi:hypothetical protein
MVSQSEARVRKDLPEALVQRLQNEIMIIDTHQGKKDVTIDQRHLIVDLVTLIFVREIDTMSFLVTDHAFSTLIDQIDPVTIFLETCEETCDINLRSNIHQLI